MVIEQGSEDTVDCWSRQVLIWSVSLPFMYIYEIILLPTNLQGHENLERKVGSSQAFKY